MSIWEEPDEACKSLPPRLPNEGTMAYIHRIAVHNGYIKPDAPPAAKPMPRQPGEEG